MQKLQSNRDIPVPDITHEVWPPAPKGQVDQTQKPKEGISVIVALGWLSIGLLTLLALVMACSELTAGY